MIEEAIELTQDKRTSKKEKKEKYRNKKYGRRRKKQERPNNIQIQKLEKKYTKM